MTPEQRFFTEACPLADALNAYPATDIRMTLRGDGSVVIYDYSFLTARQLWSMPDVDAAILFLQGLLDAKRKALADKPTVEDPEPGRRQRIVELAEKLLLADYGNQDRKEDAETVTRLVNAGRPPESAFAFLNTARSNKALEQAMYFVDKADHLLKTGRVE